MDPEALVELLGRVCLKIILACIYYSWRCGFIDREFRRCLLCCMHCHTLPGSPSSVLPGSSATMHAIAFSKSCSEHFQRSGGSRYLSTCHACCLSCMVHASASRARQKRSDLERQLLMGYCKLGLVPNGGTQSLGLTYTD